MSVPPVHQWPGFRQAETAVVNAVPTERRGHKMKRTVIGYCVASSPGWWSSVALFNDGHEETVAVITIHDENGKQAQSFERTFGAKQTIILIPTELGKNLTESSRFTMEVLHSGDIIVTPLFSAVYDGYSFPCIIPVVTTDVVVGKQ